MAWSTTLDERRFLSLDLNYGRMPCPETGEYLRAYGMPRARFDAFMAQPVRSCCVMGTDYYEGSEQVVLPERSTCGSNVLGYCGLRRQYDERYRLPVMHTETNQLQPLNAAFWLERQWATVLRLRREGCPVIGFTWTGLTDQVDRDIDLREARGHVAANGLYDKEGRIRLGV